LTVYKGIPFATLPVGDLRWKAPQPASPWAEDTPGPQLRAGVRSVDGRCTYNLTVRDQDGQQATQVTTITIN